MELSSPLKSHHFTSFKDKSIRNQMSTKIAIIGATGYVGSKITSEALDRGYDVVGINHSGSTNGIKSANMNKLHMVALDATDKAKLIEAIQGSKIIVHAGAPPKNLDLKCAIEYQEKLTKTILDCAVEIGAERVIAVGGAGTLYTNGARNMDSPNFPKAWEIAAKSTEKVYDIFLAEKRIPATVLCPSFDLFEGERTGKYRTAVDTTIFAEDGTSRISTSDFAVALIDEIEQKKHMSGRFTAGY